MILTLKEPAAKVADVFLMLSETQASDTTSATERVIETSVDDIAHWCGISPQECGQIIEHFANQRKIEMDSKHIIVKTSMTLDVLLIHGEAAADLSNFRL